MYQNYNVPVRRTRPRKVGCTRTLTGQARMHEIKKPQSSCILLMRPTPVFPISKTCCEDYAKGWFDSCY